MSITSSSSSWEVWATGNAWIHGWKDSRAQNPVFLSGKVAVRGRRWRVSVSAGARLDPESGRQNAHETVARARFHIRHKNRKKLTGSRHFLKMRPTKCAWDCSDISISDKNWKRLIYFRFLKLRLTKCARDCSESSISHKNRKTLNFPVFFEVEADKMCTRL